MRSLQPKRGNRKPEREVEGIEDPDPRNPSRWPEPLVDQPSEGTVIAMLTDAVPCEATDGCEVDPDGLCPHGHPSWLLVFGLHPVDAMAEWSLTG